MKLVGTVVVVALSAGLLGWGDGTLGAEPDEASAKIDFRTLDEIYRRLDADLSADISYLENGDNVDILRTHLPEIERRAEAGDRVAQFELGAIHLGNLHGQGDAGRAWHWLLTAAGPDHPLTQLAYGRFRLRTSYEYHGIIGFDRQSLRRAVSWMGPESAVAVPALERELHRESEYGRYEVAYDLLKAGGRGLDVVLAALDGRDRDLRHAAIQGIRQFEFWFDSKTLERVMPRLTTALDDEDPIVRKGAAAAIKAINNNEPRRKHRESGVPGDFPRPHGAKTPETAAKVERLIGELKSTEAKTKKSAADTLRYLYSEACSAVPDLLPLLKDPDKDVRHAAVDAIWFIGPGGVEVDVATPLVAALDDDDRYVQRSVCHALGVGYRGSERAIAKLLVIVAEPYDSGISPAGEALASIAYRGHSREIVAGLIAALRKAKKPPEAVIATLGKIGRNAQPAIPDLEPLLNYEDVKVRLEVAQALVKIGGSPVARAVAQLRAEMRTDDKARRDDAIRALCYLGAPAAAALPDLLALLEDPGRAAVASFRRAAEQGNADAQLELGLALREGLDGTPDPRAAERWIRRAAEQGHAGAQRRLAISYRQGSLVRRDEAAAESWYRKSTVPRAAQRITAPKWSEKAFQAVVDPDGDSFRSHDASDGPSRMIAAISRLRPDTRVRRMQVFSDGNRHSWDFVAEDGEPSQIGMAEEGQLTHDRREELFKLLEDLPAGVGYVPVEQRIVVSRLELGVWKTVTYDAAALPPKVRLVLLHTRMLDDGIEPDPRTVPILVRTETPLLRDIMFLADGTLLTLGDESRIRAYRDGRPVELTEPSLESLPGAPLGVSPDGSRVVVFDRDGDGEKFLLYDPRARRVVADLGKAESFYMPEMKTSFSSDGTALVLPNEYGTERELRSAATGEVRVKFSTVKRANTALSPDGKLAAIRVGDETIELLDTATGSELKEFPGRAAVFTRDGRQLAVRSNGLLTFYEPATGVHRIVPLPLPSEEVGPMAYSPDGRLLACVYDQDRIAVVDVAAGRVISLPGPHHRRDPRKLDEGVHSSILDIEFSPDGKTLATASMDGLIKLWNTQAIRRDD